MIRSTSRAISRAKCCLARIASSNSPKSVTRNGAFEMVRNDKGNLTWAEWVSAGEEYWGAKRAAERYVRKARKA